MKFIAQVNSGTKSAPLKGYLCSNGQVSNSYGAGTLEFESEIEATQAVKDASKELIQIIKVR